MTRVGFIGLGDQGGPMARQIVDAGYDLKLWARRPESLAPFDDTPAETASTPAELGEWADIVSVCVVDGAGVQQVLLGDNGMLSGMRAGSVVAIHSTIDPREVRVVAATAAETGVTLVDAPVSGGGRAAAARRLLVLLGGPLDAVRRCEPVFQTFGNPVLHVGEVGTAQTIKLINNALMAAHLSLAVHAVDLGDALGIERGTIASAVHHGSGQSFALDLLAQFGSKRENIPPQASRLLRKDIDILLALCSNIDSLHATPMAAAAETLLAEMGHPRRGAASQEM